MTRQDQTDNGDYVPLDIVCCSRGPVECNCAEDPLADANGYDRMDLLFGGNWS